MMLPPGVAYASLVLVLSEKELETLVDEAVIDAHDAERVAACRHWARYA